MPSCSSRSSALRAVSADLQQVSRFLNGPDYSTPRPSETLGRKETRLNQTIYAEYADVKQWLEELWDVNKEETSERISRLVEIGFFERKNERGRYVYWVVGP